MRFAFSQRCWFCFMPTPLRWLGMSLCPICRDQVYDFLWVSAVQLLMWISGTIDGWLFVAEEILLFVVLVIVKHRLPAPWDRRG